MLNFSLSWIIALYFLIPAVIKQIIIPTAELVIPTGTNKEANAELKHNQKLLKLT